LIYEILRVYNDYKIRYYTPTKESPTQLGQINLGMKVPGKPDVGNSQVLFDVAGAENVMVMGA